MRAACNSCDSQKLRGSCVCAVLMFALCGSRTVAAMRTSNSSRTKLVCTLNITTLVHISLCPLSGSLPFVVKAGDNSICKLLGFQISREVAYEVLELQLRRHVVHEEIRAILR